MYVVYFMCCLYSIFGPQKEQLQFPATDGDPNKSKVKKDLFCCYNLSEDLVLRKKKLCKNCNAHCGHGMKECSVKSGQFAQTLIMIPLPVLFNLF